MIKLVYSLLYIVNRYLELQVTNIQYTKSRSGVTINQTGQMLPIALITLGVVLFTVLFIVGGAQIYSQNASYTANAEKATTLAEAGIDKALSSLNKTGGSYNGESETSFGDGSYSVTITDKDAANKILQVTGYIPNKANPKTKRVITLQASKGVGIAFNYGLQVGEGGICMGNGATLNGSIYSNGNIRGGNSTSITGDVYVAGGPQSSADQESDCTGANCQDYVFGKNVSGENRQDVAMSFKPSQDNNLNKISLKLKKTGNPSNPTVRIMKDSSGKPDKNNVLATGTLSANLVSSSQYGFVDVTFNSTPNLTGNTTYWIMVAASTLDNSNYWYWSNDLAQSYNNGQPKWSVNWQASNPVWTSISGDLGFKTYMGGVITSISLSNGSTVNGSVHANTINGGSGVTIKKDAFYQILDSSVTVNGTKHPGSADPPPAVFPVSDANITDWRNQAVAGGVTNGNVSGCNMTLGPRKIVGNLSLGNSCTVTVKAPLWVTGNISTGNSTKFVLDSSFGATSGVIIVDGTTSLANGSDLKGSGTAGSYLMLFSTFDSSQGGEPNECPGDSQAAVDTGNSSISGIIYAPKGKVGLANGATFKEITAWQINLGNSANLTYDTGFASTVFSSGPAGSFSLVKGTYQVK